MVNQMNPFLTSPEERIAYINDIPSATDLLIMIVDDTYVVNYSLGETILLSNIVSNIKIIKKYKLDCNSHKLY